MIHLGKRQATAFALIDELLKMSQGEQYLMGFLKRLSATRMVVKYEGGFKVSKSEFDMYCYQHDLSVDLSETATKLARRILIININNKPAGYIPIFQEVDVSNKDLVFISFNKMAIEALYFLDNTLIYDWDSIKLLPNNELKSTFIKLSALRQYGRRIEINFSEFSFIFNGISYVRMHELVFQINKLTSFDVKFNTPQGVDVCLETGRYGRAILSMEKKT